MNAGMMTRWMFAVGAALVVAAPVAAQSTFPTRAAGVRAGGQVLLICDATASNCAPAGPTNAMPVTAMGGGPTSSATSQSVVPATDSAPFPVVGNVAAGASDSGNPLKIGCFASGSTPAAVATGQRANVWCTPTGQLFAVVGGLSFNLGDNLGLGNGAFTGITDASGSGKALVTTAIYYDGSNYSRVRGDSSGTFVAANQFWTESSTSLAASATLNGALRVNGGTAGGTGSRFAFFIAEAFSDVAGGTLFIDKTVDGGTTYRQVGSVALVANSSVTLKAPVSAAGYRARVVNGGTAQGAALVTTAYSLN